MTMNFLPGIFMAMYLSVQQQFHYAVVTFPHYLLLLPFVFKKLVGIKFCGIVTSLPDNNLLISSMSVDINLQIHTFTEHEFPVRIYQCQLLV